MAKLRVFLADDHEVVRAGLKALINAELDMEVVGEASDGRTAFQQALVAQPDVVIMDISMPELNGVQATTQLKRTNPSLRVVALTVHEDIGYLRELLHVGASGYVLKRSATDALIGALRTVGAGGVYLDPALSAPMAEGLAGTLLHTVEVELSDRETAVLQRIAQGYSNKEIAAQLYLSIKTVETYKARAMEKLQLNSRVDIVRYASERGWLA